MSDLTRFFVGLFIGLVLLSFLSFLTACYVLACVP